MGVLQNSTVNTVSLPESQVADGLGGMGWDEGGGKGVGVCGG